MHGPAVFWMAVVAAGCHSRSSMPIGVVGDYELVSVNGKPLPFRTFEGPDGYQEILSSIVSLHSNATAEVVTELRETLPDGVVPQTDRVTGTYTHTTAAVRIALRDWPAVTLIRDGAELRLYAGNRVYVYRRTKAH